MHLLTCMALVATLGPAFWRRGLHKRFLAWLSSKGARGKQLAELLTEENIPLERSDASHVLQFVDQAA